RANQSFFRKLKAYNNYQELGWKKNVPLAALATNISFNRAIKTSRYTLLNGRAFEFEIDRNLSVPPLILSKLKLLENRDEAFAKYANKHIQKGVKNCFDDYKMGHKVLVYREKLGNKLGSSWKEGYTIEKILGYGAYIAISKEDELRANKKHHKLDNLGEEHV
ncbi:hypothetical protein COBT_004189, partial [Conglomerata obtusa]